MLVVDPKAGDSVTSLVSKSLSDAKAESVKVSKMGRKTLAYPIRKNLEAEYLLFSFSADGEAPKILSDILKVQREEVLRFLVVRTKEVKIRKRAPSKEEKKIKAEVPKVTVKTVSKRRVSSVKGSLLSKDRKAKGVKASKDEKAGS